MTSTLRTHKVATQFVNVRERVAPMTAGTMADRLQRFPAHAPLFVLSRNTCEDNLQVLTVTVTDGTVLLGWDNTGRYQPGEGRPLRIGDVVGILRSCNPTDEVFVHHLPTDALQASLHASPWDSDEEVDEEGDNPVSVDFNDPHETNTPPVFYNDDGSAVQKFESATADLFLPNRLYRVDDYQPRDPWEDEDGVFIADERACGAYTDGMLEVLATSGLDCFELINVLRGLRVTADDARRALEFYVANTKDPSLAQIQIGVWTFFIATDEDQVDANTSQVPVVAKFRR